MDLIRGFHYSNIRPTIYTSSFDSKLEEYQWITPKKINLSFIPKKLRLSFLSQAIKKYKRADEIIISLAHTQPADITICGGQHKGYLQALSKNATLLDKYKIYLEQKAYYNSKIIIAHSQLMKLELINLYQIPANKIEVIYPPVDTQKFHCIDSQKRSKLREKFGFNENEIIYLFPSTGHARKGFELLKHYFEQTTLPIKLVVAGTPVQESKRIRSLGFCKNMPELYQAADFTIMASKYEPFGLVGIESILCGTPIIFSKNMACTEVLQNYFGHLFDLDDAASLHHAIQDSLQQKSRIHDPFSVLSYHPTLEQHMISLLHIIQKISSQNR
ncbi:glycosyltransferase family 4 protein [Conservatibacter flavescens]|uniref:glycosyltransferase family 4 protein n=1 Tax=Conservatibacter flavescens TaxID=28161 RepID=UPI001FAE7936|nr:glycosyltransferase family 4 protein [Conservatibacter flavescens]